jgi:DNA-binding NarL/FixJ family response regulator
MGRRNATHDRTGDTRVSILIADDELLFAQALRRALEPSYRVLAIVGNGNAAIAAVQKYRPDIVLLDVSMPVMNGFEAAEVIAQSCPSARIIFVSNHMHRAYVEEAFNRGAAGYVPKGNLAHLQDAIRMVLDGQQYRPDLWP